MESVRQALAAGDMAQEFIVSDDGSTAKHVAAIESIGFDVLALSDTNYGLGHNCNKGIAACRMPLLLQVQDDWRFTGQPFPSSWGN